MAVARDTAVIAVGGDGSLNTVAQAAHAAGCAMGVIPYGTFNYFARTHGIATEPVAAARQVLQARPVPVQVGAINERIFLVNASLGIYPELLQDREAYKARFGRSRWVAFVAAGATLLRAQRRLRLHHGSIGGIGGFLAQQRVVAADNIDRRKATLQVLGELGGGEFHRRGERGAWGAPSGLLDRDFNRRLFRRVVFVFLRGFQRVGIGLGLVVDGGFAMGENLPLFAYGEGEGEVDQGKPLEDIGADKQRERKLFGIDRGLPDGAVRPIHTAAPVASLHRFYIGLSVRLIIIGVEVVTYDRLQFPGFQRPLGRPDIEPPAKAEPVERTYGQLAALAGVIHQRLECAEEAFYARVGVARMEVLFEILQPGLVHVEQLDRPVLGIPSDNMPQRLVAGRRIVFPARIP